MTLEETLNKYKQFGANDFDIIRLYFTNNKLEAQAVQMLTELCQNRINKQYEYISAIKEYSVYSNSILYNERIDLDTRRKLAGLCQFFINWGKLDDNQLKEAENLLKDIKKEDFTTCPIFFLGYLQSKGIGLQFFNCIDERSKIIEEYADENVGISF